MGFSNQERINLVTKALAANVLDANAVAQWYETLFPYSFILASRRVWTQYTDIEANPAANLAQAQANAAGPLAGIILDRSAAASAVQLTQVSGTNYSTWAAYSTPGDVSSPVIDNWIQPQMSPQATGVPSIGYAVRLYNGDPAGAGVEIPTTAGTTGTGTSKTVGWIFNYAIGMLLLSEDFFTETGINPATFDPYITGFTYIGGTAAGGGSILGDHAAFEDPPDLQTWIDFADAIWRPEYSAPSVHGLLGSNIYVGDWSAYGGAPGTPSNVTGDGTINYPFATCARALQLIGVSNATTVNIRLAPGSHDAPDYIVHNNWITYYGYEIDLETITVSAVVNDD